MPQKPKIVIIGAGLAGSEAALQLGKRKIPLTLYDMKPEKRSPAHHSDQLAEIVCSNSFGNLQLSTASGLLKEELRLLGSELIEIATRLRVPAGNALAVDREAFSREITRMLDSSPYITRITADLAEIPEDADFVIIATGPLTSEGMIEALQRLLGEKQLYFFDAAAPILVKDSIDFDIAFYQNRYNRSFEHEEGIGDYINLPLSRKEYLQLVDYIISAPKIELKELETTEIKFFESCLPVEILAKRGIDVLRYGPMKPVGIVDPKTGRRPYAVVQLRKDNQEGTLYNMVGFQTNIKWSAQKEMISMIPGLANAEIVRYGVMHRNTFINSPKLLQPTMELRNFPGILIAGQLTGVEGYTESIASGLMASLTILHSLAGEKRESLPDDCMMGALFNYISHSEAANFQPMNSNWGILPPLEEPLRDKKARNEQLARRAMRSLRNFVACREEMADNFKPYYSSKALISL